VLQHSANTVASAAANANYLNSRGSLFPVKIVHWLHLIADLIAKQVFYSH
jgi:hypothetical protein